MERDKELDELVETLTSKVIKTLHQQGFINLTRMRNERIKYEFRKMRRQNVSVSEAIQQLSDKDYFTRTGQAYRVGVESIMKIVYKEIKNEKL